MRYAAMIVACAAGMACMAQSVTSEFVPVRAPGNVFDPIPEASGGNDSARLVDTPEVFSAAYVEDFAIDGDMAKKIWRVAPSVSALVPMKGREFQYDTEVKLLYSATALYVGATFHQPMDKLRAQYDQDDQSVYDDDSLEILFLVPSGKGEDMLHLSINALGSCYDAKNGRSVWNLKGRDIKAKRLADRWTLEMRLPFAGLGIERPVPGDFIGARFCRVVHEPKFGRATMPQLTETGINQRRKFGKLVFSEPGGKAAQEAREYRARITKERAEQRLAAARRRVATHEAAAVQFPDQTHPAYNLAVQAVHQMRAGLEKFEKGELSTADFIALDAGFRKFAGEHAYAVWTASPWEKGSPDRLPPVGAAGIPRLAFEQAGNEREQVCIEFTGLLCGPRIDLRLVPLTVDEPKKRRFVSCDAFEIYEEPFVNYEKELITAPLVRKPGNMITLTPGRTVRVWVVFNSRGVKPGEYKTKIMLKPAYDTEVAEQAIDVDAKVWSFSLPETREWPLQTFFWGPNYYDNDEAQTLRLMHDHHVTHGWTKSQLYTFGIHRDCRVVRKAKKDDSVYFDRHLAETANEDFFRTAKDLGMRFVFGWGAPDRTPEWFRVMDSRLRGMGFDRGDYIFKTLLRDEFVKEHIPLNADRRAAVTREFGTNLWFQCVYLSTPPPTGATMDDIEAAKIPEFYKMFVSIDGIFRDPIRGPDVVRRLRAKGCKVWTYTCARYMQTQDVLNYYRFYLWNAYMRGLDGAAMWMSGGRYGDDGWDSRDEYDDGILWAGNGKEMIPTKRFEAFREGLEDVAYMSLLGNAGTKEAKALLAAREDVIKSHDQKTVDAWRLAAGRAIDGSMNRRAVEARAVGGERTCRDVVIYGSSPAAISAAVQAKRMGRSAVVVSPETRIGGLTTGGLGQTDIGNKSAFGGIALEFYRDVAAYYADPGHWTRQKPESYFPDGQCAGSKGKEAMWTFEPSAALSILEGWERRDGLDIRRGEWLDREHGVEKKGGRIVSIRTLSGKVYCGKVFVDATYEGDLMAAAGVSYAVGREANSVYGESLDGNQPGQARFHQLNAGVDPYVVKGDPGSGLLPGVEPYDPSFKEGEGDRRVQAYCFRMCLTDDLANRIPFAKPEGYVERDYELLFRHLAIAPLDGSGMPWINSKMPNRKTDTNNRTGFSTDFIGRNWRWPEASYAERDEIRAAHLKYQRGLMWTLANHPRVPEEIRREVSKWGTCRDEFADGLGDGWQTQLYVREARRMVGEYVMTEHNCWGTKVAPRPVAVGAYQMDSHHVRRYVGADGFVHNEGDVEVGSDAKTGKRFRPYPIDYGAVLPRRGECANLVVPVCLSASHIAFGSIRMEPVFFALGQVAGTAASIAASRGVAVQDVPYAELSARLISDGQVISAR